jgi:hypothetical protein
MENFGDGSNRWLDGAREFASDPGQLVRNPYDTVAGAADAGALNFDEGVGGLASLVDNEPGNTAGSGDSSIFSTDPSEFSGIQLILALAFGTALLWVVRPVLEIVATLLEEVAGEG